MLTGVPMSFTFLTSAHPSGTQTPTLDDMLVLIKGASWLQQGTLRAQVHVQCPSYF